MFGLSKFVTHMIWQLSSRLSRTPSELVEAAANASALNKAISMPIPWIQERGTDKVVAIVGRTSQLMEMISLFTEDHYSAILKFFTTFFMAINILPQLWWVLLAPLPVYGAWVYYFDSREDKAWDALDVTSLETDEVFDMVSNARDVKVFGAERSEALRHALIEQYRAKLWRKGFMLSDINHGGQQFMKGLCSVMLILVCFDALSSKVITAGQLGLLITLQETLFAPLNQMHYLVMQTKASLRKVKPLFALLRVADPLADHADSIDLPVLADRLSVKNLSFSYLKNAAAETLQDISFDVPKGTTTAIVGPSGAGKSTLSSLLLRLYDPASGSISWDGINLKNSTRNSLRKLALLVPQGPFRNSKGYPLGS